MVNKKLLLITGIILILFIYLVVGITLNESFNNRISNIEAQIEQAGRRREYYSEQRITLAAVKSNLESELALEKDKAEQQEIAAQLIKLDEANQQLLLQQQEQQRLAEQARLLELQQQQAAVQASTPRVTRAS